jgi:hypothetical protein
MFNYDRLIEIALESLGFIVSVISDYIKDDRFKLFKLHGSVIEPRARVAFDEDRFARHDRLLWTFAKYSARRRSARLERFGRAGDACVTGCPAQVCGSAREDAFSGS